MNKKRFIFAWVIILAAVLAFIYFNFIVIPTVRVSFGESEKPLNNPSRGFYVQFDSSDVEDMDQLYQNGINLALITFDIKDFNNRDISREKLSELDNALQKAKDDGLQVIFRAAYGFDSSDQFKDPSDIELIKKHIGQIATVINNFSETILCVQAGFLGPWGEWHHSSLLKENDEKSNAIVRNAIIKCLLEKLNNDILIGVRRPRFIRDAAAAGINTERLSLHNDALLSTSDDMGTYDDPAYSRFAELEWMDKNLVKGVSGGEMPKITSYSAAQNALKEFESLHLTYLNHEYNQEVLNAWKKDTISGQNAYDYISNHLGYRLSLKEAVLPERVSEGSNVKVEFTLKNTGFACLSKKCNIQLAVKTKSDVSYYPVNSADLRRVYPNSDYHFNAKINLPEDFEKQAIRIGLVISEKSNTEDARTTQCIELANKETMYKNGINYFSEYLYDNKKHWNLVRYD